MEHFIFTLEFKFKGHVQIIAKNKEQARQLADHAFGAVNPNYHESVSTDDFDHEGILDWDMPYHPIKIIKGGKRFNPKTNCKQLKSIKQ